MGTNAGAAAYDTVCDTEGDSWAAGTWKAFVSTNTTAAMAVITPSATYVRADGIAVGTGAQLLTGVGLETGPWMSAGGGYHFTVGRILTGSATPMMMGADATTCMNWGDTGGTMTGGREADVDAWWTTGPTLVGCNMAESRNVYCVEQ